MFFVEIFFILISGTLFLSGFVFSIIYGRICPNFLSIWAWKPENSSLCPKKSEFEVEFGRGSRKSAIYAQKQVDVGRNLGVGAGNQQSMPKKEWM